MKENLQQGESGKKWKAFTTKHLRFVRRAIRAFTQSYLSKQGLSKRLIKKVLTERR